VSLSFCGENSNFCVAVTGEPDWEIVYIDLIRMKIIGSLKIREQIDMINVNPKQIDQITIIQGEKIRSFRSKEDTIIAQTNFSNLTSNSKFTNFAWFDQNTLILVN